MISKTKKLKEQQELLIKELKSIKDIQKRIDQIADDLDSKNFSYSLIDAYYLASLLGLDYDENEDWESNSYCYRSELNNDGYEFPYAEHIELLEQQIPIKRFKELSDESLKVFAQPESNELKDLVLTSEEIELLNDAYADWMAKDAFSDVKVVSKSLTSSAGGVIFFEAQIGDYGEVYHVSSPYDIENGEGFNYSEHIEIY